MSWQASEWGAKQTTGSSTNKLVLILLGDRADEAHSCYPGIEDLVTRSELSERAVRNAIAALVEGKLVRVLRRGAAGRRGGGRRSNRYQLMVDGPNTPLPPTGDWSSEYDPVAEREKARDRKAAKDAVEQETAKINTKPAPAAGNPQTNPAAHAALTSDKPAAPAGLDHDLPAPGAGTNRQQVPVSINRKNHQGEPSSSSGHARAAAAIAAATDADDDEAQLLAAQLAAEHRPRSLSGYVRSMAATRQRPRAPTDLDLALTELRANRAAAAAGARAAPAQCGRHPGEPASNCGRCRSERIARPDRAAAT